MNVCFGSSPSSGYFLPSFPVSGKIYDLVMIMIILNYWNGIIVTVEEIVLPISKKKIPKKNLQAFVKNRNYLLKKINFRNASY